MQPGAKRRANSSAVPENPYEAPPPLIDDDPAALLAQANSRLADVPEHLLWARGSTILALGFAQLIVAVAALADPWFLADVLPGELAWRWLLCGVCALVGVCILQRWARRAQVILSSGLLVGALAAMGRNLERGESVPHGMFFALVQLGTLYLFVSRPGRTLYAEDSAATRAATRGGLAWRGIQLDSHRWAILFKLLVLTVVEFLAAFDINLALARAW
jgi:hypothetical protein